MKMDPALLKTVVFPIIILFNIVTWTKSIPVSKQSRLSIADWANYNAFEPQGAGTYAFGYDVEDPETNNIQYRDEERHPNGTITGSYGYLRPDGIVHIAHYVADEKGYRVSIETNPRGQLRPNGTPQPSSMSSALASALRSKQVYKKQRVHEERTRPIDKFPKSYNSRSPAAASYHTLNEDRKFSSYSNAYHEPSGFDNRFIRYYNNYDKPPFRGHYFMQ